MDIRSLPTFDDGARWPGVMLTIFKLCLALLMLRQVSVSTVIVVAVIGSAVHIVLLRILAGVPKNSRNTNESTVGPSQEDSPQETTPLPTWHRQETGMTWTENVTPVAVGRGWVVDWTVRYDL
jgi:hypothetical protein